MKCRQYENLLLPYLEGAFSAEEQERIGRHLEECAACGEDIASLSRTVSLLKATRLPVVESSPHLWEAVRRQIEKSSMPFCQRYRLALAVPALAASLALAVLLSTGRPTQPPTAMMAKAPESPNLRLAAPLRDHPSAMESITMKKGSGHRKASTPKPLPATSDQQAKPQPVKARQQQADRAAPQPKPSAVRENNKPEKPLTLPDTRQPDSAALAMRLPGKEAYVLKQDNMAIARNPSQAEASDQPNVAGSNPATMAMKAEPLSSGPGMMGGGFGGAIDPETHSPSAPQNPAGPGERMSLGAGGGAGPDSPRMTKNRSAGMEGQSGPAATASPQEAMFRERFRAEGRQALFRYP
ncbi:MAG: zf-HC2 domain-containing protein [Armatimonadetes bacterium]|nr:zf-HC2 domain-containing protein [Armatimonadota bacterium]